MKVPRWNIGLHWSLMGTVSLIFLVAGIGKLCDLRGFIDDVDVYELVPMWGLIPLAAVLPWLEIVTAVALWIPKLRPAASYLVVGLCLMFCIAITSALLRGIEVSCGCFGAGVKGSLGGSSGAGFLARDIVLLVICLWLTWNLTREESRQRETKGATYAN